MTVSTQAKALTRRGWMAYNDIRIGEDETLGYNPLTTRLEWTLILNVYSFIDSELWNLTNGVWTVTVAKDQEWVTDEGTAIATSDIGPDTRILTRTPSADSDTPIYLASRRQFVTRLRTEFPSTGIAWTISTGNGYWFLQQGDNVAIAKGFDP